MMELHAILADTEQRAGLEPVSRYTEKQIGRLVDEELLFFVDPEKPTDAVIKEDLAFTRDDHGGRTVVLPAAYRIPSGDSKSVIKDVTELLYHEWHLKRFVQAVMTKRDKPFHIQEHYQKRQALRLEDVRATGVQPSDMAAQALWDELQWPTHGSGIPRPREAPMEPRPKLGVGYMTVRHQFVLFPYINVMDGTRIFARSEMRELEGRPRIQIKLREHDGQFNIDGKVSSSSQPGYYRTRVEGFPLRQPYNKTQAAEDLWSLSMRCGCPDYQWTARQNTRMAQPTIKGCKHLVATLEKAMTLFRCIDFKDQEHRVMGNVVPIPLGSNGYAMHRIHELETRVLIENEAGSLQPLNKTELSWWLGKYEDVLVGRSKMARAMFVYDPLRWKNGRSNDAQTLIRIERENMARGPAAYSSSGL